MKQKNKKGKEQECEDFKKSLKKHTKSFNKRKKHYMEELIL